MESSRMTKLIANWEFSGILTTIGDIVFSLLSLSYSDALRHYTTQPMIDIAKHCPHQDSNEVRGALADFKTRKTDEIDFVQKAATLSAAAAIGVFSWPSIAETHWSAQLLWNCSFFAAIFALVGTTTTRLLRHFPDKKDDTCVPEPLLYLLLRDKPDENGKRVISRRMVWVWQNPMMLMSWSWVLFLVGYGIHLLSPVIPDRSTTLPAGATYTILGVYGLITVNFIFCAILTRLRISGYETRLSTISTLSRWRMAIRSVSVKAKLDGISVGSPQAAKIQDSSMPPAA